MSETMPEAAFVQVFDATKAILTQRCDSLAAAARLGQALREELVSPR
jgi:hypothetical protein